MLRTLFIGVFLSLYIIVAGIPLLLYTVISKNPDALYWAGVRGVMFFVRAVGVRVRIAGTERIPSGPCLFVANHTSTADAHAVVGAIPRRIAILLKKSLFAYPIVGQAFHLAHFVPVDRPKQESAIASLEQAIEASRSPHGRLQEFKKGAVVMAIKAGVPIVPIACSGAHRVMRKQSLDIHPGEILVEFLTPICASQYTFEEREKLNALVHDALAAGLPPDQRPIRFPGAA